MYNLLFIVSNQVLVVFNLKYEYGTDIFTKQQKSDNDKILNFDVKAEQLTHIKFVEISEKDLMRPPNCLNKNHTIASDKLLKFMGFFSTDCLPRIKTKTLDIKYLLHTN